MENTSGKAYIWGNRTILIMCYDISFTINVRQLSDYFPEMVFDDRITMDLDITAHMQGHAHARYPILFQPKDELLVHCKLMEWGIIPFYVTDKQKFARQRISMLNIRSEKILDDAKSYWHKIRNRRCLVPVTGFYEHRHIAGMKNKIPYLVQVREQPIFFLPGLYSVADIKNDAGETEKVWTYALITREAVENKVMQQIHNSGEDECRMPLLLPFELAKKWITGELNEAQYRAVLDYEMPANALNYHTVYTIRSNKERPDGKRKDEEYDWGEKVPAIKE